MVDREEHIGASAYTLWKEAGEPSGQHDEFWFRAEHRLIEDQEILVFAYDRMMNSDGMKQICPDAELILMARFPDHALCFFKRSGNRKGLIIGFSWTKGTDLWGVVWKIRRAQIHLLDQAEGYMLGRAIESEKIRKPIEVYYAKNDTSVSVNGYYSADIEITSRASKEDLDLIVTAAEQHHRTALRVYSVLAGALPALSDLEFFPLSRGLRCRSWDSDRG